MLFTKKYQLGKQLMAEIKSYAGVNEFPLNDAKIISQLLVAYNKGEPFVGFAIMSSLNTLEKYPNLADNWDNLMIKYKRKGLFNRWNITPF